MGENLSFGCTGLLKTWWSVSAMSFYKKGHCRNQQGSWYFKSCGSWWRKPHTPPPSHSFLSIVKTTETLLKSKLSGHTNSHFPFPFFSPLQNNLLGMHQIVECSRCLLCFSLNLSSKCSTFSLHCHTLSSNMLSFFHPPLSPHCIGKRTSLPCKQSKPHQGHVKGNPHKMKTVRDSFSTRFPTKPLATADHIYMHSI